MILLCWGILDKNLLLFELQKIILLNLLSFRDLNFHTRYLNHFHVNIFWEMAELICHILAGRMLLFDFDERERQMSHSTFPNSGKIRVSIWQDRLRHTSCNTGSSHHQCLYKAFKVP